MSAGAASCPLRIAFVFDDTLDVLDGVQQHIVTLGRELARRGHEVHYIVGETHRSPMPHTHVMSRNVMVRFNGNRMRIPLPASRRRIRETLETIRPDILHVQAPYSPLMAGRVLAAAPERTGVVATYHIAPIGRLARLGGVALGAVNARSHRRVDEVVAVSDVAADYARATAHVEAQVIPNPVDVARLRAACATGGPDATDAAAHGTGAGGIGARGGRHVAFLGRFVPRKGATLLLDALAWGERHGVAFPEGMHVTCAGMGPLLDECRRRAAALHTPVTFPGFVSEREKATLLAAADVAVFPSTGGESFGIVLLEAIAAGSGVTLAGDNPGYRSTLLGDTDALFPVDARGDAAAERNAETLARRIARALTDADWAARLHAREETLLARYDVTAVADRLEAVYAKALADRRR